MQAEPHSSDHYSKNNKNSLIISALSFTLSDTGYSVTTGGNTGDYAPKNLEFRELLEEAPNTPGEPGSCMLLAAMEHRQAGKEW